MLLIQSTLRVAPGGLVMMGTPCSAHVWVSCGSTHKSRANPRGDISVEAVRQGNGIATRAAMIILLAIARNLYWATEQPGSSCMVYMEAMKRALCMPHLLGLHESLLAKLQLDCRYCLQDPDPSYHDRMKLLYCKLMIN